MYNRLTKCRRLAPLSPTVSQSQTKNKQIPNQKGKNKYLTDLPDEMLYGRSGYLFSLVFVS